MRKLILLSVLFCLSLSGTARADGIVVEQFHPSATLGGYITADRPETPGHLRLFGELSTSFARSPLRAVAGPFTQPLIDYALSAQASLELGILRFLSIGVALPFTFYQAGAPGSIFQSPASLGDLMLNLKGRLWTSPHAGLGLLGTVYFPTGSAGAESGIGQVAFAPRLLFEARFGPKSLVRLGLNAGVLLRQAGQLGDFTVSHQLTYALGLGLRPHRVVELLGEVYGTTPLLSPWQEQNHSPTEAAGKVRLHLWRLLLSTGAAAGIVNGYGTPAWRLFVQLGYEPRPDAPPPVQVVRAPGPLPPPPPEPAPLRPAEVAEPEVVIQPSTLYRGNAEIVVTDTEVVPQKPIFFELNHARVTHEFFPILDALAQVLRDHPELGTIRIDGHTDATGAWQLNQQLSIRRATAVRDALIRRHVDPARLQVIGFGPTRPIADNDAETGRRQNRRVVFYHEGSAHTADRGGRL